jgi:hypothetical protein
MRFLNRFLYREAKSQPLDVDAEIFRRKFNQSNLLEFEKFLDFSQEKLLLLLLPFSTEPAAHSWHSIMEANSIFPHPKLLLRGNRPRNTTLVGEVVLVTDDQTPFAEWSEAWLV